MDLIQDLNALGTTTLNNAVITGDLITKNTTARFGGDLILNGENKKTKNINVDLDSQNPDNTEFIQYVSRIENSNLTLKNNIICKGEQIILYKFLKDTTIGTDTIGNMNTRHEQNFPNGADDFFTILSVSGEEYFLENEAIYGKFVKENTTVGGEIECISLEPTSVLKLDGDLAIYVNGQAYTKDRLAKTLNITNDNNDRLQLIDVCLNTLNVSDNIGVANNISATSDLVTIKSPLTVQNNLTVSNKGVFDAVEASTSIRAQTLNVEFINFLSESTNISSVTSNTSFAIYRNTMDQYGSSGLLMRQNGNQGSQTRGIVYIYDVADPSLNHRDVFFIGRVTATGTSDKVTMEEKGKLITNIFDSDYIYTKNAFISEDISINGNIINDIFEISHDYIFLID